MKITVNQLMEKLKEIQDKGYGETEIIFSYQYKTEQLSEDESRSYYKPLQLTNYINEQVELMEDYNKVCIGLIDKKTNKDINL